MPSSLIIASHASHAPVALVVDDVLLNRVVLAVALRQLGYRVVQAVEGEEALRRLDEAVFHVVCLDWNMPGLNGDEVARRIRARPDAPPIIAITADDSLEMKARCKRAGVAGQLVKGFKSSELSELLNAVAPLAKVIGASSTAGASRDGATRKLLMARSQEQFAAERRKFGQALAERQTEAALRFLHNIASLSGLVGASEIHGAAKNLETRLRMGDSIEGELAALDVCLYNFQPAGPAGPL